MDENKVVCPYDKTEVEKKPFGFGYVWICPVCNNVLKSIAVGIENDL